MIVAPIPVDEDRRLVALGALGLLDTPAEDRFDRIVELASLVMDTPIALVSLIDRDRQWFKAGVGLDATETDRDIAFCAHAIVSIEDTFVVEDTLLDERFADNPLVVGDPSIRFYAGHVLRSRDGSAVGTLCAIDRRPRPRDDARLRILALLGGLVEQEFERETERALVVALAESEHLKGVILDTLSEGLVLQDQSGRITQWNPAAERLLGLSGDELSGRCSTDPRWMATSEDGTPIEGESHPAMVALRTGQPVEGTVMSVHRPDGSSVWLRVNAQPVLNDQGQPSSVLTAFADVTAERTARHQQRALEESLRLSEHMATISLDALEQGVILASAGGVIHRMNPAAEQILGYNAHELSARWGSGDWVTFDADGIVLLPEHRPLARAVSSGERITGETIGWRRRDGSMILIRLSCIPDADDSGALLIAFTDVTDEHRARKLLDATMEMAPVGLAVLDGDRRVVRCNPAFATQVGVSPSDLLGVDVLSLVHPGDRSCASSASTGLRSGAIIESELDHRVVRSDGNEIWVNTRIAVIPDPDRPLAIAATFDVTEQRRMTLELSRFSYLFAHANDIIIIIDAEGTVLYASPSSQRVLGYPEGSRQPGGVLRLVHPADIDEATCELRDLIDNTSEAIPFTVRVRAFDGSWRHMECVGVNLLHEPAVAGIVITARDATERERLGELLSHQATHDTLTDLPNRSILDGMLTQALARAQRSGTQIGVCFIDLDGFKAVNDTYGHAAGDDVLIRVSDALRRTIRAGDTALRIGGDEFVVIYDNIRRPGAALGMATRLRDALIEIDSAEGIRVGASIGLALSQPDDTPVSILQRADTALYRAKIHHNSVVKFDHTATPAQLSATVAGR